MKILVDIPESTIDFFEKMAERERKSRKACIESVLINLSEGSVLPAKSPPPSHPNDPVDNAEIQKQIEAIKNEKVPPGRDTRLGRLSWQKEQWKRIELLENKLV